MSLCLPTVSAISCMSQCCTCQHSLCLQNVLNSGTVTLTWLVLGYGLFHSVGPSLVGAEDLFFPVADSDSTLLLTAAMAVTASSIVSGAVAGRIDTRAFLLLAAVLAGVVFPVVARSVWYPEGMPAT